MCAEISVGLREGFEYHIANSTNWGAHKRIVELKDK